ncbi:MBL fold metallo-hydrolase (plasmid) [Rhizobium ruizarguesonis]|nr:MBL fold metallo-hydrolase [Rhizobium ruizarguesonis]TCA30149.1 MBL fold metallo-hydrolase [Rhizobium leguminosarum bv. viciae]TBC88978.1 MBL fold metallo-hydrolase [Rhizobium ruizarguesonis]TBD07961.1 MBL fold metallo-hydrolase [Rhizobium ruizarguesonis]TBD25188.1 MBL fold metallo-hydrolase [Rhizobium ruizarguesonis]
MKDMTTARTLLFSTTVALLTAVSAPTFAVDNAPATARYQQVTDSYSFPLGDLRITALSDGTVPQDLYKLLIGTSHAHTDDLLDKEFLANPVEASINAFLIQDGTRTILVDTGSGDLFGPGNGGKLLDSLSGVGVKAGDVTDILITHIHTDHTGGLVRDGRPAFPNATAHVGAPDLKFFLDPSNARKTGYADQYFDEAAKTIGVYEKLGKAKTFGDGDTILPGIATSLHPGHTPGSAFFTVTSKGRSMTFIGDVIHVAAVQFPDPNVTIVYDVKPRDAASVRKETFSDFAARRELVAAPHLPFPGIGYIRVEGPGSFSWHPVQYRNRAGQ